MAHKTPKKKRPHAPSGPRAAQRDRGRPARGGRRTPTQAGAGATPATPTPRAAAEAPRPFHGLSVVGITLGEAGMQACAELVAALPPDLGLAIVVTFQTGPRPGEEQLRSLLSERSRLTVVEAADDMPLLPNRVHVMPPGALMAVEGGKLRTAPPPARKQPRLPADFFFRSLAASVGSSAVGIVMCGADTDGAIGLQEIKGAGGITIAQEPTSANQDGAPRSAISTGAVDVVLAPAEIAHELTRLARHPIALAGMRETGDGGDEGDGDGSREPDSHLPRLFAVLRNATGVDFTHYKSPTIQRRLQRRMLLHKIDRLETYVRFLQQHPAEVQSLYQDLLIKVTRFFREPESFDTLARKVFPGLAADGERGRPIRIWVPGCSTGEEAYSVAIALLEHLGDRAAATAVQIFATDVSEQAVEHARAGTYTETIAADVSPERLRRFFTRTDGKYRINKMVRDMVVFARQDLTRDPPFSRLDLIVCRNVLIYLGPVLQKRLMTVFHYALRPDGFLMLGAAETTGLYGELFSVADKRHRVYRKKAGMVRPDLALIAGGHAPVAATPGAARAAAARKDVADGAATAATAATVQGEANRVLLNRFTPPGVVVDDAFDIVQFRGQTGAYLQPPPGEASLNVLKMAREGLLYGLRTALLDAKARNAAARRTGLRVKHDGRVHEVAVEVVPLSPAAAGQHYLVLFEETPDDAGDGRAPPAPPRGKGKTRGRPSRPAARPTGNAGRVDILKSELAASREYMQSIIQDLESANEELQSANEEILSSNEELQSTNEELDTAKEELQSTNEELNTLNEELHGRNDELSRVNSDLVNLLGSVDIAIVMVDSNLRIRRFTPTAEKVMNLIPTDVGRKIGDIRPNVDVPDLENLIAEAIDTVSTREREAHDRHGRWYSLRVRPYKNMENRIDGAVLALIDVEAARKQRKDAREADSRATRAAEGRDYAEAVIETVREPLIILGPENNVRTVNRAFRAAFHVTDEEVVGKPVDVVLDGHFDTPAIRKLLEHVRVDDAVEDFEVEQEFPKIGRRRMLINARRVHGDPTGRPPLILLALAEATRGRKDGE